jgi:acetyltransferase-like isoleucine patch superfamily enzyme
MTATFLQRMNHKLLDMWGELNIASGWHYSDFDNFEKYLLDLSMLWKVLRRILDINFCAEWQFSRKTQFQRQFVCRGRIQLSLARTAIIHMPTETCCIGTNLLGDAGHRDATTVLACASNSVLKLNGALIGRGACLSVGPNAELSIGNHTYISQNTRISAQRSISIGQRCAISFGVTILDNDGHGFGPPPYSAPIKIEDDVWIGCNVTLLKGVTIGQGSVIAAGSVVTRSCPSHSLLAGVPARVIREGVSWTDAERLGLSQTGVI